MKRLLPTFGALVLVGGLVGAVVWLRPEPEKPPVPKQSVKIEYADGAPMWDSTSGTGQSLLVRRVLADLDAGTGLTYSQAAQANATIRSTIDHRTQQTAAEVATRRIAEERVSLRHSITAVDPETGGVRAYWPGPGTDIDQADLDREPGAEALRPFAEAGRKPVSLENARVRPLDLAAAYVPLASGGFTRTPHFISNVRGADGALLYQAVAGKNPAFAADALRSREIAGQITTAIQSRNACSEGTCVASTHLSAQPGRVQHAWVIGYSPVLVTTVFVGGQGPDDAPLEGAEIPRVIVREFLSALAG